jgi:hypothetical protein
MFPPFRSGAAMYLLTTSLACLETCHGCARRRRRGRERTTHGMGACDSSLRYIGFFEIARSRAGAGGTEASSSCASSVGAYAPRGGRGEPTCVVMLDVGCSSPLINPATVEAVPAHASALDLPHAHYWNLITGSSVIDAAPPSLTPSS